MTPAPWPAARARVVQLVHAPGDVLSSSRFFQCPHLYALMDDGTIFVRAEESGQWLEAIGPTTNIPGHKPALTVTDLAKHLQDVERANEVMVALTQIAQAVADDIAAGKLPPGTDSLQYLLHTAGRFADAASPPQGS